MLDDGPLSEWFEFCERFGKRTAKRARATANDPAVSTLDWLAGDPIAVTRGSKLRVSLSAFPQIQRAAQASRRPVVWCLYRVARLPVYDAASGARLGEERIPVPVAMGAARPETITQHPPEGVQVDEELSLWCRGWDDSLPESHRWGIAPAAAAWILELSRTLKLPSTLRAR